MLRYLLIFFLYFFAQHCAMAKQTVSISVANLDNNSYEIIFTGLNADFAYEFSESGKVDVKLPLDYELHNIKALEVINHVVLAPSVQQNNLTFFLRNNHYKLNKKSIDGSYVLLINKVVANTLSPTENYSNHNPVLDYGKLYMQNENVLIYETDKIVGASAFTRGRQVFLVFSGKPKKLEIPKHIKQIPHEQAVILTFNHHTQPTLRRVQNHWIISLNEQKVTTSEVKVRSLLQQIPHPVVEIIMENNPLTPVQFTDEATGVNYISLPAREELMANTVEYRYVNFHILPSVQGVNLELLSDNIKIEHKSNAFIIGKRDSMFLSKKKFTLQYDQEDEQEAAKLDVILDLLNYHAKDGTFVKQEQEMRHNISDAASALHKEKQIFKLALFNLANGFVREALTVSKLLTNLDDRNIYKKEVLQMVLYLLREDFFEAHKIGSNINISSVPMLLRQEVKFWQLVTAMLAETIGGENLLNDLLNVWLESIPGHFVHAYTPRLRMQINNLLLQKYLPVIRNDTLLKLLKQYQMDAKDDHKAQNLLNYYYAIYHAKNQASQLAYQHLDKCLADPTDLLARSLCLHHKAQLDLANLKITKKQYIDVLELASMIWHGDDRQINILLDLADSYLQDAQYLQAMRSWSKAVEYFPNHPRTLILKERISNTFSRYFLDGYDVHNTHLQALELFYEFQRYLPIGSIGDDIVIRFTDHLIALDLLDKAIPILLHQVNYRLKGFKKEESINKLAKLQLANQQPYYAIEALRLGNDYRKLPDTLGDERKMLLAEALAKNGQYDESLMLLEGDYSQQADAIKSGIFWQQQNWLEFLNYAEPAIYEMRRHNSMLTSPQAKAVLQTAIAYLMTSNGQQLLGLYNDMQTRIPTQFSEAAVLKIIVETWKNSKEMSILPKALLEQMQSIAKDLAQ